MLFSKRQKKTEEILHIPTHIAIIMDGNGRWAKKRNLPRSAGHAVGCDVFERIATYCRDLGVKYLTVYAFSTENWKRSQEEVQAIMNLLRKYLDDAVSTMEKKQIRLRFFGDMSRLDADLQEKVRQAEEISSRYTGFQANICLNYGGRDEIIRAARQAAARCVAGEWKVEDITESSMADLMDSAHIPDPELIIRPSGEVRTSNFLLWQSAYSEYYFTDVLWPDFTAKDLDKAITAYNGRSRRFGG